MENLQEHDVYNGNPIMISVSLVEYRDLVWFKATAGGDLDALYTESLRLSARIAELEAELAEKEKPASAYDTDESGV
ncbi:hypothetical protein LJC49_01010 [Ruminococcaceae bacterium OttesenSCG-928-I18]|nr:hypothetical protein [Ruminococcaceae bacterium OttesenSCG-928-I18]